MGSFNSAPKIHNVDSQDDDLKVPQGYPPKDLIQYFKSQQGSSPSKLLSRYFLKPTSNSSLYSEDITDGLRVLKLNSISRGCGSNGFKSNSNLIRILQWNMLSQCKYSTI